MSKGETFAEYYKYYLTLHQNKINRWLHVAGQCVTILVLACAFLAKSWLLLLLVPLAVYPFAWIGHLVFEKNKPAAWSHPVWAKMCDWVMLKDIITGRLK